MTLKLWLDDEREAPEGWEWARSVDDAIMHLIYGKVTHASLDHDLGAFAGHGGDAIELVKWMSDPDWGIWPTEGVRIHSGNPIGRDNMLQMINKHGPYPFKGYGNIRGNWED